MVVTLILIAACRSDLNADSMINQGSSANAKDQLLVQAPTSIRVGDIEQVTLILQIDGTELIESQNLVDSTANEPVNEFTEIFLKYNILVKTRFDMAGVNYAPRGELFEPLKPGIPVKFNWKIRSDESGKYQGTIWVYLVYIPLAGGESEQRLFSIQNIDVRSKELFGLSGSQARVIGTLGTIVGSLLIIDILVALLRKSKGYFTKSQNYKE